MKLSAERTVIRSTSDGKRDLFAAGAEGAFRIPNPIALGTETMKTKTAHTGLIFVRRIPGAFRNAGEGTGSEAEQI